MNQIAGCVRRLAAFVLCACLLAAGLSGCSSAWNAPADSAAADGSPVSKEDLDYDASLGVIDTKKFEGTVLPETQDAGAQYVADTLFLGDSNTVRFMMYGDEKTGVRIIAKALEAPIRQIAANAGLDGSVILEKVRNSGKVGYGFDAYKEEYCDMIASGIVDPAKVTRSALENAASVSGMVLTTESLVADKPQPAAPAAPAPDMGGMGGMY